MKNLLLLFGITILLLSCGGNGMEKDAKKLAELSWKASLLTQKVTPSEDSTKGSAIETEYVKFTEEVIQKYKNNNDSAKFVDLYNKAYNELSGKPVSNGKISDLFLKSIPNKFTGKWISDIDDQSLGLFDIGNDKKNNAYIKIEVNSNQIYINAKATTNPLSPNVLALYLDKPYGLGPGGATMPWNDYSKDKPVCFMEFLNPNYVKVNWVGFYNNKTQKIEYKEGTDWSSEKTFNGKFKKSISINTQKIEGDQGQTTFSINGSTLFYFNLKLNNGKIVIDDKEYILNKITYDKKTTSYLIIGDKVKIETSACKFNTNEEGGDCANGTCEKVKITLITGGVSTFESNVQVQDCPNYN